MGDSNNRTYEETAQLFANLSDIYSEFLEVLEEAVAISYGVNQEEVVLELAKENLSKAANRPEIDDHNGTIKGQKKIAIDRLKSYDKVESSRNKLRASSKTMLRHLSAEKVGSFDVFLFEKSLTAAKKTLSSSLRNMENLILEVQKKVIGKAYMGEVESKNLKQISFVEMLNNRELAKDKIVGLDMPIADFRASDVFTHALKNLYEKFNEAKKVSNELGFVENDRGQGGILF